MIIEFSDIISIFALIFTFLSVIIAYYLFQKQETWKEKRSLTDLLQQFKRDIETFYIKNLLPVIDDMTLSSFLDNIPFYESQQEKLIKLGIIVLDPNKENQGPVSLRLRIDYACLIVILNKYYIGVYTGKEHHISIEVENIGKHKAFNTIEEVEGMLKEMIEYTKKYFEIKINEKIIDLREWKKKLKMEDIP